MGSLKPGATYIYERSGGRIYAREMGKSHRTVVGYEGGVDQLLQSQLRSDLNNALAMCEQHPDMKELLDKLLVLYNLRKTNE